MATMANRAVVVPSIIVAALVAPFLTYFAFIGLGSIPFFQRQLLYLHKINPFWQNVDQPEAWAFAKNQVTPFSLKTQDGERLYAWHVLPTMVYLKNEDKLKGSTRVHPDDFESTDAFNLLKNDPDARVVVSFHGNAGHVAQGYRTEHYHSLTDTSNYHLLTIDYRGFGKSTGKPSETGLLIDGITLVDWVMHVAGVPADRIVLVGHSLGTAVATGVAENFVRDDTEFAGIVLISAFANLTELLTSYAAGGVIPILSPIKRIAPLVKAMQKMVVDKWESDERIGRLVRQTKRRLRLTFVHAKSDKEIPYTQSDLLFRAAAQELLGRDMDDDEFDKWKFKVTTQHDDGTYTSIATLPSGSPKDIAVREEIVQHGGHNYILTSSYITMAVMRNFES